MQAGLAVVCGQGSATAAVAVVFKKNLNAAKPPEQSKYLGDDMAVRFVLPSTGDFDGNLCISLSTSYL